MKSILISIKPKWVAKILNGEKTVEIRKTEPKCDLPVTVYIYCTKGGEKLLNFPLGFFPELDLKEGKPVKQHEWIGNGKVVARFTLEYVQQINYDHNERGEKWYWTRWLKKPELYEKSGLDFEQINNYLNKKLGYAWYIEDLEIFDEPKELSEFYSLRLDKDVNKLFDNSIQLRNGKWVKRLDKAPQSWCYVEEDE